MKLTRQTDWEVELAAVTGTLAGVALGLPDTPYLRAGDTVELEIDGLG
jgi:2-keto-4-pentenoate hydratase/2-oxohepta-3-ene-1,7-dioic acid hydratase in catechol pathway